jgi:FkbM family methyltransferase
MRFFDTFRFLNFVLKHPLNSDRKYKALGEWVKWHLGSRLVPGPVAIPFVNNTCLLARPGLSAATENIYTGLAEFEDMSFLLHILRPGDVFIDIGANIGSYTVLASGVCEAESISFEPIPSTFSMLQQNINLNGISGRVELHNCGLGDNEEKMLFTKNLDSINHVVTSNELLGRCDLIEVPVYTLDKMLTRSPTLMKIDVEGFEAKVLAGGKESLSSNSLVAVIIELNGSSRNYGSGDDVIHETLLSYGFKPFSYRPLDRKVILNNSPNSHARNALYLKDHEDVEKRVKSANRFCILGQMI